LEGTGTNELFGGDGSVPGDIYYQLDFVPVENGAVAVPDGCEVVEDSGAGAGDSAANGEDYPVMGDAANVAAFGGLYSYETSASMDEAIAFYKSEYAADGWTLDQEIVTDSTSILTFVQGGEAVSVAFNVDPNGGDTLSVVIVKE